jgi:hypothetical protein
VTEISLQNDLLKQVNQLPSAMQQRVLDFARALAESEPQGVPGDKLLQFSGMMTPEEAREFLQSIEEDCERIEPGDW